MKVALIPIGIGVPSTVIKGTGELGNKRKGEDHRNYRIVEIGQNRKKSPGDLRRLSVTQTPVETICSRWCEVPQMSKKTIHSKRLNSSIRPIDGSPFGTTIPGQSRSGCNDNEKVVTIPQSFWIEATSLDCLVSYPKPRTLVVKRCYPSVEVQSLYSTAPPDWVGIEKKNTYWYMEWMLN